MRVWKIYEWQKSRSNTGLTDVDVTSLELGTACMNLPFNETGNPSSAYASSSITTSDLDWLPSSKRRGNGEKFMVESECLHSSLLFSGHLVPQICMEPHRKQTCSLGRETSSTIKMNSGNHNRLGREEWTRVKCREWILENQNVTSENRVGKIKNTWWMENQLR